MCMVSNVSLRFLCEPARKKLKAKVKSTKDLRKSAKSAGQKSTLIRQIKMISTDLRTIGKSTPCSSVPYVPQW